EDRDFFDAVVREAIETECEFFDAGTDGAAGPGARVALRLLAEAHPAIRHRLIIGIFGKIGLVRDIEASHIAAADRLIGAGRTGKSVDFPAGYRLETAYDRVIFSGGTPPAGSNEAYPLRLADLETKASETIRFRSSGSLFRFSIALPPVPYRDANSLRLDFDALRGETDTLILRTRRPGDRISPEGMDGSKKLQDLFVDVKTPRAERERAPLLASGNDILWVPGKRKTRKHAIRENTKRILIVTVESIE
ncbi:MAG: tRNA lysidine(34) synthetase TilS, partial [Clostridiales Family XIII bacterium]|nr:tRNA lysidine(34) synthetase TilS [Clostridiales Family XIII bacterium]